MASIAPEDIYLIDQWPGPYNPNRSKPGEKWDSTKIEVGNNCATPSYPPGTKIMGFTDKTVSTGGAKLMRTGGYGMIYVKYVCSTTAIDISASEVVIYSCGSASSFGTMACTREMTGGNTVRTGACGIACADCTPNAHLWLWCDGFAPFNDCTTLDVTGLVASGCIGAGDGISLGSGALDSSYALLRPYEQTAVSAVTMFPVGMAYTDDT